MGHICPTGRSRVKSITRHANIIRLARAPLEI